MIKKQKMLINNKWLEGKEYFSIFNPYSGEIIGECPIADRTNVENAIFSSKKAFSSFSKLSANKRSIILEKTSHLLSRDRDEIAKTIVYESGKAWKYAYSEVGRAMETFKFASEEAKQIHGETVPLDASAGTENKTAFYKPFPIGVIAAIAPFNFPLNLVAHKVAPAIAAGNTVVLKPASTTPLTALKLGKIMIEAGLPEGVLNIIMGGGKEIGNQLTNHPDISLISFTGSPKVGTYIKSRCGLKKTILELGANSAAIIEADADLKKVIPKCITGSFANSGQVCISIQRIYIQNKIFNDFKENFCKAVKNIKIGNPMDKNNEYGPMIESKETKRAINWIEEAKSKGAELLMGGEINGDIILPTVLTKVTNDMKVCYDEVFAPIVSLFPYNSFEDAIDMVNDSLYGLNAGVFTNDIQKAFYAFNNLEVGGVIINDTPTYRSDNMPYGGVKMSGSGREGIKFAISEMMELKLLVFNLS